MPSLLLLILISSLPALGATTPAPKSIKRIFAVQCGACHFASSPTANGAALKVFDLDAEDWLSQILRSSESVLARLEARRTMSREELRELSPRGVEPPPNPTDEEIATVRLHLLPITH